MFAVVVAVAPCGVVVGWIVTRDEGVYQTTPAVCRPLVRAWDARAEVSAAADGSCSWWLDQATRISVSAKRYGRTSTRGATTRAREAIEREAEYAEFRVHFGSGAPYAYRRIAGIGAEAICGVSYSRRYQVRCATRDDNLVLFLTAEQDAGPDPPAPTDNSQAGAFIDTFVTPRLEPLLRDLVARL